MEGVSGSPCSEQHCQIGTIDDAAEVDVSGGRFRGPHESNQRSKILPVDDSVHRQVDCRSDAECLRTARTRPAMDFRCVRAHNQSICCEAHGTPEPADRHTAADRCISDHRCHIEPLTCQVPPKEVNSTRTQGPADIRAERTHGDQSRLIVDARTHAVPRVPVDARKLACKGESPIGGSVICIDRPSSKLAVDNRIR